MKYYVIINGNSSLDIQGLAIESLPNISKPLIRTTREEIDGRDGDVITKLGYSAYDKTLNIGLWGNYDINEVIAYFNEEGVITFSNEPDKYYKFHILNRIDFVNQLEKFKKASITIHCQPFKYKDQEAKVIEEEEHTTSGTSFNLSDTLEAPLEIDLKGNTSQTGTPTPSSPIPINNVSGDNEIVVCGKNLYNASIQSGTYGEATYSVASDDLITQSASDGSAWNISQGRIFYLSAGTYTMSIDIKSGAKGYMQLHDIINNTDIVNTSSNSRTFTLTQTTALGFKTYGSGGTYPVSYYLQIEKGETATTYEPYTGNTFPINLPVENLFDKDNANIGTFYIYNNKILTSTTDQMIILSIKPNTTYTIQKGLNATTSNNRFKVGTCVDTPANNVALTNYVGYGDGTTITSITITSGANDNYLVVQIANNQTNYDEIKGTIQIEYGTNANTYTPYGTMPIELCKTNTNYEDGMFHAKDGDTYYDSLDSATKQTLTYGKWYKHNAIGKYKLLSTDLLNISGKNATEGYIECSFPSKVNAATMYCNMLGVESLGATTDNSNKIGFTNISTNQRIRIRLNTGLLDLDDSKTMVNNNNYYFYYQIKPDEQTNTEITYTPLIEQLNTLEQAQSKEGTTNINQVNNDLPFIIDLTYYTGDTSITITNDGNIYSKPLLELKGTGNINIYLNGIQVFVVSLNNEIIYIDTDKMEAYYQGTLKNRQVVGDYNNFKLQSGNNTIQVDGGYVEYLKITNYSRWV